MAKALPYNEKNDAKQDKKTLKGLTPAQKAKFEKLDKKHKKVKLQKQDEAIDKKIIAKIKKQVKKK